MLAALTANIHRGKNKRALKMQDFMPRDEEKKEQSWEAMLAFARAITPESGQGLGRPYKEPHG